MLVRANLFALLISCNVLQHFAVADGEFLNGTNSNCELNFLNNCAQGQFCEDVTAEGRTFRVFCNGSYENISENVAFSKCCSLNMSYNGNNRTCEENLNAFNKFVNVNKRFGLSQCGEDKVVLDYISEELPNVFDGVVEVNGKKFGVDQFCVDGEVLTGKYVVRVCVDNQVCDGNSVACIRKCCPDGHQYGINRTCERVFENKVNWNELPDAFQHLKGKNW